MLGALAMEQLSTAGSQELKKDRSEAQEEAMTSQSPPVQSHSVTLTNGDLPHAPNGIVSNGAAQPTTSLASVNGDTLKGTPTDRDLVQPPPLDQSWRQHDSNKSLGRMIERVAQKCYKDLNSTLTKMSEIPVEPSVSQLNGIIPHAGEDTVEGSLKKKRLLLEFAKEQRDVFIKTLVLTDWCRNEEDQSSLIDLKVWQEQRGNAQDSAIRMLGQTKMTMINAKVPAPNIEGAMELMATGKASGVPDLAYLPPKRLTAKQLLKTLRNMNVILATRLNLHEDLPPHFSDFTIADGRATFTVRDEFEVDLSVADEDPATPFYFIDIRLAFTPASNILNEQLRGYLERKVNQELATKGLRGCYDFLHALVLTHKINIMRSQGAGLIRGKWFECIRTENMRRSFIIQYWSGRPGKKSWIEIGISSGKQDGKGSRRAVTPRISVRWFRHGEEIKDHGLVFDWRDLNLERCLSMVITKHIDWILRDVEERIRDSAASTSPPSTMLEQSEESPFSSALLLKHPSLKQPLHVRIEPVTGRFSITPPSLPAAHTEHSLNTNAKSDAAKALTSVMGAVAQEKVHRQAMLLGWKTTPNLAKQDNLPKLFGQAVRHISVFTPSRAWGNRWALVATFTSGGEKWWAVSLDDKRDEQSKVVGRVLISAVPVGLPNSHGDEEPISSAALMRVERLAVAEAAFSALTKQLKDMKIPFTLEKLVQDSSAGVGAATSTRPTAALLLQFSPMMKATDKKAGKPWAAELVRLTHHGIINDFSDEDANVRHDLRLTLQPGKLDHLREFITHSADRDVAMNDTGGLALRFRTAFGQPFAAQIQQRLQSVHRLDNYIATLKRCRFTCDHVSLSRLGFTYNESPKLAAELLFSSDKASPVRLKLEPSSSNPHQLLRVLLEQDLNDNEANRLEGAGFATFCFMLKFSLPVLQTVQRLQSSHPAKHTLTLHPRSSAWYSLKYLAPLPDIVFQLRARKRIESGGARVMKWHVEPSGTSSPSAKKDIVPQELNTALKELWKTDGEHWDGLGSGIVADADGIGTVIEKVDELVRRFERPPGEESKAAAAAAVAPSAAPAVESKTEAPPTQPSQNPQSSPSKTKAAAASKTTVKAEPDVIMLD